jgi:pentatricopeptide repeat protein
MKTVKQRHILKEGIALAMLGDFDKAITYYDRIMKRNPKDINVLYDISCLLLTGQD